MIELTDIKNSVVRNIGSIVKAFEESFQDLKQNRSQWDPSVARNFEEKAPSLFEEARALYKRASAASEETVQGVVSEYEGLLRRIVDDPLMKPTQVGVVAASQLKR